MPPEPEGKEDGGAVAHLAVQVAAHRGQIAALTDRVEGVEQALADTPNGKALPAVAWDKLTREEAAAARADLRVWVGGVLLVVYPSAGESLQDCWPAHQDAVCELTVLWLEYRRIFAPARPPLADALVFHDRWLPGVLRRVGKILEKCGQFAGCVLSPRH